MSTWDEVDARLAQSRADLRRLMAERDAARAEVAELRVRLDKVQGAMFDDAEENMRLRVLAVRLRNGVAVDHGEHAQHFRCRYCALLADPEVRDL